MFNLQYSSIGLDNGLSPTKRQVIIWTNGGIIYWRIYASLDLNELRKYKNTPIERKEIVLIEYLIHNWRNDLLTFCADISTQDITYQENVAFRCW